MSFVLFRRLIIEKSDVDKMIAILDSVLDD